MSNNSATKDDIKRLEQSTKDDIKRLEQSTKGDIKRLEQSTKNDIKRLEQSTKTDIKRLETKLDKLQITLDGFVGVVDDLRTDNTIGTYQTRELRETVENHEKRLQHLESTKQIS